MTSPSHPDHDAIRVRISAAGFSTSDGFIRGVVQGDAADGEAGVEHPLKTTDRILMRHATLEDHQLLFGSLGCFGGFDIRRILFRVEPRKLIVGNHILLLQSFVSNSRSNASAMGSNEASDHCF